MDKKLVALKLSKFKKIPSVESVHEARKNDKGPPKESFEAGSVKDRMISSMPIRVSKTGMVGTESIHKSNKQKDYEKEQMALADLKGEEYVSDYDEKFKTDVLEDEAVAEIDSEVEKVKSKNKSMEAKLKYLKKLRGN